jgi:hypothetical protein
MLNASSLWIHLNRECAGGAVAGLPMRFIHPDDGWFERTRGRPGRGVPPGRKAVRGPGIRTSEDGMEDSRRLWAMQDNDSNRRAGTCVGLRRAGRHTDLKRQSQHHLTTVINPLSKGAALALALLFWTGCASSNVDPARPRHDTGYVDFYAEPAGMLSWRIEQIDSRSGKAKILFEQYAPLKERIVRLALRPGRHQLRVSFLNLVIVQPATVEVEVRDGRVTPVKVRLIEAGTVLVETKEVRVGATYYGRYGRATKLRSNETTRFQVQAQAREPEAFEPKARMPYAVQGG